MPLIVIADMLGIPAEHRRQFKIWSDKLVGMSVPEFIDPQLEMREYFLKLFEERRREPQNDLVSDLLKAEQDGEKLSEQEILGFCVLLLVAGNETTTNLIGNTFLCLDEMPGLFEQLRSNPELIPAALEEVARYLSPLQFMFRGAAQSVEMGGQTIKAGQIVHAYIGSAKRDEKQFADPDRFDLTHFNSKHLANGNGIHYCIGAPLARLQAKVALTYVVKGLRNVRLDPDVTLEANSSRLRFLYGVKRLPVLFDR